MRYLLLVYGTNAGWAACTPDDFAELMAGHDRLQAELRASHEFISAHELPPDAAAVVRLSAVGVQEGPLHADPDILAGFYEVECATPARAAEIAAALARVEFGLVEVRQVDRAPRV